MRLSIDKIVYVMILFATTASFGEPTPIQVPVGDTKMGLVMNVWGVNDPTLASDAYTQFRIRRVEVKFSGSLVEKTKWTFMFDPAKSLSTGAIASTNDNKIIQDAFISYSLCPELDFQIGQFKIFTTSEGLAPTNMLILPERSYLARAFGDRRETGAGLVYKREKLSVRAMTSNGTNAVSGEKPTGFPTVVAASNTEDPNGSKDWAARAEFQLTDELKIGGFASQSNSPTGFAQRGGVNVFGQFERMTANIEGVQAYEYQVLKRALVADVQYKMDDHWYPAIRWENFEDDYRPRYSSAATAGVSYYMDEKGLMKIQGALSMLTNFEGKVGSYSPASDRNASVGVINFQASY